MNLLIFLIILYVIHILGTFKLYQKAGRKSWEVFIPIYNYFVLIQMVGRPKWWMFLLFIPVINKIILLVLYVNLVKCFGRTTNKEKWLTICTLGFYTFTINYNKNAIYKKQKPRDKGAFASIIFAVVVATIIRTFTFESYVIPTPSMEKSLMVLDMLFVNKFSYGLRPPMTPVSIPMVHDKIPFTNIPSYIKSVQLPYFRWFNFSKVKNNDIVVFNWPVDTMNGSEILQKPIDKKTNYVKRFVGIAGDSLKIINGDVYINGKLQNINERLKLQYYYKIKTNGVPLNQKLLKERYDVTDNFYQTGINEYKVILTEETAKIIKKFTNVVSVNKDIESLDNAYKGQVFPFTKKWNQDNFGPIYIPKKGATVNINFETLPFYKRIITTYENNKLEIKNNKIFINGKETNTYTFKDNYYWAMGDNRHNSLDSRFWGYVPETHIVGKPVLIWMSINKHAKSLFNKIRWDRLITVIHGEGKPKSYFIHLLVVIGIYYVWRKFRRKKKVKI